jgi:hypothetical protein
MVMVTLMPIRIKNHNIPQKRIGRQRQMNCDVLKEVLLWIFQHLTLNHNAAARSGYYTINCVDGNLRRRKPVLEAWHAECPAYRDQHHLERHVSFWCMCPPKELGDYFPPDKKHPLWNHNLYTMLSDTNTKAANTERLSHHVHQGFIIFENVPGIMSGSPEA